MLKLKGRTKGSFTFRLLKMMVPLLLVIPGVIAARLVPGLTSKDFAYPSLVARSLPWPVVGLFVQHCLDQLSQLIIHFSMQLVPYL